MSLTFGATIREGRGKGAARALRRDGHIPAVLYGFGVDAPLSLDLDPRALQKALDNPKGTNALFTCEVEGHGSHQVLVREIQRHAVRRNLMHVDLVAPDPEKPMLTQVPLRFEGKSVGVSMGGRLRTPYREIKILARPAEFPGELTFDLGPMDIGHTVMASDIDLGEGVKVVYERDFLVIKIVKPRGKKAEPGADDGKKKKK